MGRILGLDLGGRRIGVAVSDPQAFLAQGHSVLECQGRKKDLEAVAQLAGKLEVEAIVVGHPLLMDGRAGAQARQARRFASLLAKKTGLPVVLWDERLSTVEVERMMVEAGLRRQQRKEKIDAATAQLILQSYLDFRAQQAGHNH
ncbi:MAG: Holliday junction resolvase RuvX [Chloroflexi bacterium]|nr:Holliday junction resolvase RuvX [Chloroflexota bacterium]